MENSLLNKTKFFAQYYGQEIALHSKKKYFVNSIIEKIGDNYKLSLKSIDSISNIDICKCVNLMGKSITEEEAEDFKDSFIEAFLNKEFYGTFYPYRVCEIVDYLRSKSYAIPYNGLSIDELISFGWVVLE